MSRHLPAVLLFILCFQYDVSGQSKRELEPAFFVRAEVAPSYPGGEIAWEKYILANLNATEQNTPPGIYAVIIKFLVEKDGSLTDINAVTNYGYGMEEEAKRLIKESGKWVPATQNGRIVRSYQKQAIIFRNTASAKDLGIVMPPAARPLIESTGIKEIEAKYKIYREADVDIKSNYVGGIANWNTFLNKNLDKNVPIKNGAKPGRYEIVIQFVVGNTGVLSNITPLTSLGYGMEDEAIRIIKKTAGLWTPAILHNKEVYSYRKRQIIFDLGNDSQ